MRSFIVAFTQLCLFTQIVSIEYVILSGGRLVSQFLSLHFLEEEIETAITSRLPLPKRLQGVLLLFNPLSLKV